MTVDERAAYREIKKQERLAELQAKKEELRKQREIDNAKRKEEREKIKEKRKEEERERREYLREFNQRLGTPLSAAQWMAVRRASTVPDEAVLELARRVGQRRPVALLTNNGPLFKRGMGEIFPALLEIFGKHAYCSYEFGDGKPEPVVFEGVARALGVPPAEVFFVDDTEEYIQGAASIGVQAHWFRGVDPLRQELERLALI